MLMGWYPALLAVAIHLHGTGVRLGAVVSPTWATGPVKHPPCVMTTTPPALVTYVLLPELTVTPANGVLPLVTVTASVTGSAGQVLETLADSSPVSVAALLTTLPTELLTM